MCKVCSLLTKAALGVVVTCFMALPASAQPKSAGATFSFTGLGVSYEHDFSEYDSFLDITLKSEHPEYLLGRSSYPGISAGIGWNIIIREWKSTEGNTLRFFAGPGAVAGYAADRKVIDGVFFGVKGRVGGECEFTRNILISISISPIIGAHIIMQQGDFSMKYYKNGLIYSLVPEIGIKYCF